MEQADIMNQTPAQLREELGKQREALRDLRFKVANKQLKNVRQIRVIRATVARLLTELAKRQAK